MKIKKNVKELDDLDNIADELNSITSVSKEDKSKLEKISLALKTISNSIYVFYKNCILKSK